MSKLPPIDLFHIGPQKSGTTWVYEALREHPGVQCPKRDSIHYFDMFHAKGRDWLDAHFPEFRPDARPKRLLLDATPSYLRSTKAPARIFAENPAAKIILCLREPVERAFSHYWHEKKKGKYRFEFPEILKNYDLFSCWLETGFYADAIERYQEFFPMEQILCQDFSLLQKDPAAFLRELLDFCGLDPHFTPSVLNRKVNSAGSSRDLPSRLKRSLGKCVNWLPGMPDTAFGKWSSGREEYLRGVDPALRVELAALLEPEILRLEKLLNRDLSHWRFQPSSPDA